MAHMAGAWIWRLLASLILLAIGTPLKSVAEANSLKLADDEIARLEKKRCAWRLLEPLACGPDQNDEDARNMTTPGLGCRVVLAR